MENMRVPEVKQDQTGLLEPGGKHFIFELILAKIEFINRVEENGFIVFCMVWTRYKTGASQKYFTT